MRRIRKVSKWIIAIIFIPILIISGIYLTSYILGPPNLENMQNTEYYTTSGEKIGEEQGAENRKWVKLADIPPSLINATIAIEDQRFYEHFGLDIKRILGA